MKRISLLIIALLTVFSAQAADLTGVKIYINPGHGGYDSNDRSVWTVPVPEVWTNPDGYWESKSNLVKSLALKDLLEEAGATVIISRTENTSGIRDGAQFAGGGDRDLTEIAEEANASNVDHFLSVHTNALGTTDNYLLLLFHGSGNEIGTVAPVPTVPDSWPMVQASGPIQYNNPLTVWTIARPALRGDFTFYGDNLGLGVLRPLTVPGFLSEGSFHDYPPETHRLMNADYCKLEALRFFEHFHKYFQRDMPATGTIAGFVKSVNEQVNKTLNQPKFTFIADSDDKWLPLNGATVKLLSEDGSQELGSYTTDNWYNGIFAFYNIAPGNYKLQFSMPDYDTETKNVTVTASEITYSKAFLKNPNLVIDEPDPPVLAAELNIYASGLSATVDNANLEAKISYTLNAPATELVLDLQETDGEPVEIPITGTANLTKGAHTNVVVSLSNVPTGNYTWRLKATGAPTGNRPSKMSDDASKFKFYIPVGLAVDNSFESPHFGRIYVAEGCGSSAEANAADYWGDGRISNDGIYAFTPTLDAVNTEAYTGNVSWSVNGTYADGARSPGRLATDASGKVFISDISITNSGVYIMEPAAPEADFTSALAMDTRATDGIVTAGSNAIHGRVMALYVEGSGDNTTLYTIDRNFLPGGYSPKVHLPSGMIFKYPIGSTVPYASLPEIFYENDRTGPETMLVNDAMSLVSDKRGGFWAFQYRSADATARPSLIHLNASGTVDWVSGTGATQIIANGTRGAMAVNQEGNIMAVCSNKHIIFFSVTYDGAGIPTLTLLEDFDININGTNIEAVAFDVAGNLYAISPSTERLYAYAMPKSDDGSYLNTFITPAPSTSLLAIDNESGIDANAYRKDVKSVSYNTLTGVTVPETAKGLLLKKTTYTDGSVTIEKILNK